MPTLRPPPARLTPFPFLFLFFSHSLSLRADRRAASYYQTGYPAMGKALQTSGRDIVYSCSWPAYLGSNESTKP